MAVAVLVGGLGSVEEGVSQEKGSASAGGSGLGGCRGAEIGLLGVLSAILWCQSIDCPQLRLVCQMQSNDHAQCSKIEIKPKQTQRAELKQCQAG